MSGQHLQVVGRYLLGSPIASGGMATVHLGRPLCLPRVVAIKRLSPHLAADETFVRMFLDEVQLLCRIRHKNVVAPIEHFQEDGEFFIVMEYVEGLSLAQLSSASEGPLDAPLASKIMSGVLTGLHAAHEAFDSSGQPLNMVHRDVSPHNILLGTDGESRIADFGIAKAAWRAHVTQYGERKGKPGYMSPEQWALSVVDRRSDVYSVGVVLWELLTGKRLFADPPVRDGSGARRNEVPPPSKVAKGLCRQLDDVALRALRVDPDERFPDAETMAEALRAAAAPARDVDLGAWVAARGKREIARRAELITELENVRPSDLTPVNRGYSVPDISSASADIPAPPIQKSAPPADGMSPRSQSGFKQTIAMASTVTVALVAVSYLVQSRSSPANADSHREPAGEQRTRAGADHGQPATGSMVNHAASVKEPSTDNPDDRAALSQRIEDRSVSAASSALPARPVVPPASVASPPPRAPLRGDAAVTSAPPAYDPLRDARRR
jgi:serine/threonine-protein kinase